MLFVRTVNSINLTTLTSEQVSSELTGSQSAIAQMFLVRPVHLWRIQKLFLMLPSKLPQLKLIMRREAAG